jgi:hypothetical protein
MNSCKTIKAADIDTTNPMCSECYPTMILTTDETCHNCSTNCVTCVANTAASSSLTDCTACMTGMNNTAYNTPVVNYYVNAAACSTCQTGCMTCLTG